MTQEPTRILLSEAASRALSATGESCFTIVTRCSHPENPKRWVIILEPVPLEVMRAAEAVALGKATARFIKKRWNGDIAYPRPS